MIFIILNKYPFVEGIYFGYYKPFKIYVSFIPTNVFKIFRKFKGFLNKHGKMSYHTETTSDIVGQLQAHLQERYSDHDGEVPNIHYHRSDFPIPMVQLGDHRQYLPRCSNKNAAERDPELLYKNSERTKCAYYQYQLWVTLRVTRFTYSQDIGCNTNVTMIFLQHPSYS